MMGDETLIQLEPCGHVEHVQGFISFYGIFFRWKCLPRQCE